MEVKLLNLYQQLPYSVALLAGILTFLSPCILPLIPAYMSYISGMSLEELKNHSIKTRIYIFQKSLLFIAGFSTIFVIMGISFNTIVSTILSNSITNYIAGGIIVIFGIHFLGIIRFRLLYASKQMQFNYKISKENTLALIIKFLSPFILGVGFALGWTPCVGPILSSIMILSTTDKTGGLSLMIVYAIGLAIPFLLTALAIERLFSILSKIKKYARVIEIINGIILIAIGFAVIFGGLDRLNELLT